MSALYHFAQGVEPLPDELSCSHDPASRAADVSRRAGWAKEASRSHTDTTVPRVPADERDIMAALLKTLPPPTGNLATRKHARKGSGRKRKQQ